jgi:hypothetical protein
MKWKKIGKIFDPEQAGWIHSHAQVPTALVLDDRVRVIFAGRNKNGKSFPAYVDLDKKNLTKILEIGQEPCMTMGAPGTFDDDGVMPSEVFVLEKKIYMFYSGWNQKVSTPYHNSMGLSVSTDGGKKFERVFEGPIMDRTPLEPYVAVTPTIYRDASEWKMWYVSGLRWQKFEDKYEPVYVIKYAVSADGFNWIRPNIVAIPQKHPNEAFSRPCVVHKDGKYHMWYCFRDSEDYRNGSGSYRMGYSVSDDGVRWVRKDEEAGIDVTPGDWDGKMICYPYIAKVNGLLYMFYNGDGFGKHGFGCAVLEE